MGGDPEYDPRFLAGVDLFNAGDYFAAHEVWEDLWHDCPPADRRFVQSLIQAAVALYHAGRGNQSGAERLAARGFGKAAGYPATHRGLDVRRFWEDVMTRVRPADGPPPPTPRITLTPPPDPERRHDG